MLSKRLNSKELHYYDSNTGAEVGQAKGLSGAITNEEIENSISLFEKLRCIQDRFNITYTVPDEISCEDIYWINVVFELIHSGFAQVDKCNLMVASENIDIRNRQAFDDCLKKKIHFMMQVHYQYINIWDKAINFEDELLLVMPESYSEVNDDRTISIHPVVNPILIFKKANPKPDIQALVDQARKGAL